MAKLWTAIILIFLLSLQGHAEEATLLEVDREAVQARLDLLLDPHTKTVDITTFILMDDQASKLYLAALGEALDRGVKVRFIVDLYYSHMPMAYMTLLMKKGMEVRVFHDVKKTDWILPWVGAQKTNQRLHDKLMIFNRNILITGGRNIEQNYFYTLRTRRKGDGYHRFRDKDILVQGEAAQQSSSYFDQLWNSDKVSAFTPKPVSPVELDEARVEMASFQRLVSQFVNTKEVTVPAAAQDAEFISNVGEKTDRIGARYLEEIRKAKREIIFENPYVILTKEMKSALIEAVHRGVKVVIYTNGPDGSDVGHVGRTMALELPELVAAGIHVYQIDRQFVLHSKIAVFDRETTIVGSYNLDNRSDKINYESGVIIKSRGFSSATFTATLRTRRLSEKMVYQDIPTPILCEEAFTGRSSAPLKIPDLGLKERLKLKVLRPLL